jgi:hypothetical protein
LLFYHVAVEKKATKLTFMFMAPLISDITSWNWLDLYRRARPALRRLD